MAKPIVAIPGGTSKGLGRAIVTALLDRGQYTPIVISRQTSKTPAWLEKLNVEVKRVDYENENNLIKALDGVETVLCTLLATDGTWLSTQRRLLSASLKAGVRRFAPAEWGPGPLATAKIEIMAPHFEMAKYCREAKQAHEGKFEWAGFHGGLFMNYLGQGARDEAAAMNGINDDGEFVFFLRSNRARLPVREDGGIPSISLTEIGDVGKFAAAACELPFGQWQENMSFRGDVKRLDEIVEIIERVRGKKLNVSYRTPEEIAKKKETTAGPIAKMWLELDEMVTRDREDDGITRPVVNELCPDVRPITIEEYVQKYWGA